MFEEGERDVVEAVSRDAAEAAPEVEVSGAGRVVVGVESQAIARPVDGRVNRGLDELAPDSLSLTVREHRHVDHVQRATYRGEVGNLDRARAVGLEAQRSHDRRPGTCDQRERRGEGLGDGAFGDVHRPGATTVHLREEGSGTRSHLGNGASVRRRGEPDLDRHRPIPYGGTHTPAIDGNDGGGA